MSQKRRLLKLPTIVKMYLTLIFPKISRNESAPSLFYFEYIVYTQLAWGLFLKSPETFQIQNGGCVKGVYQAGNGNITNLHIWLTKTMISARFARPARASFTLVYFFPVGCETTGNLKCHFFHIYRLSLLPWFTLHGLKLFTWQLQHASSEVTVNFKTRLLNM